MKRLRTRKKRITTRTTSKPGWLVFEPDKSSQWKVFEWANPPGQNLCTEESIYAQICALWAEIAFSWASEGHFTHKNCPTRSDIWRVYSNPGESDLAGVYYCGGSLRRTSYTFSTIFGPLRIIGKIDTGPGCLLNASKKCCLRDKSTVLSLFSTFFRTKNIHSVTHTHKYVYIM